MSEIKIATKTQQLIEVHKVKQQLKQIVTLNQIIQNATIMTLKNAKFYKAVKLSDAELLKLINLRESLLEELNLQ